MNSAIGYFFKKKNEISYLFYYIFRNVAIMDLDVLFNMHFARPHITFDLCIGHPLTSVSSVRAFLWDGKA